MKNLFMNIDVFEFTVEQLQEQIRDYAYYDLDDQIELQRLEDQLAYQLSVAKK
mgnify:CR=1 FL=1